MGLEATIVAADESAAALQAIADAGHRQARVEFSNRDYVRRRFAPIVDIGNPVTEVSAP